VLLLPAGFEERLVQARGGLTPEYQKSGSGPPVPIGRNFVSINLASG
jgi:hypothetical protein